MLRQADSGKGGRRAAVAPHVFNVEQNFGLFNWKFKIK
jgi:hypothetical protein